MKRPNIRIKEKDKERKFTYGKVAVRQDHPRRHIEIKFCMVGSLLRELVLSFEFHQNQLISPEANV